MTGLFALGMPLCSNEGLRNWQQEQKCYNRVWDYRADVQYYWSQTVNQALNWAVPLVPRSLHDDGHGTWEMTLCECILSEAGSCEQPITFFMTPVMPRKRLLVFSPPFFFPFLRKAPSLIPDIESNTRVSAFYSIIFYLNGMFPSLWVWIGNVETNWNRLELKSSETITYNH